MYREARRSSRLRKFIGGTAHDPYILPVLLSLAQGQRRGMQLPGEHSLHPPKSSQVGDPNPRQARGLLSFEVRGFPPCEIQADTGQVSVIAVAPHSLHVYVADISWAFLECLDDTSRPLGGNGLSVRVWNFPTG